MDSFQFLFLNFLCYRKVFLHHIMTECKYLHFKVKYIREYIEEHI